MKFLSLIPMLFFGFYTMACSCLYTPMSAKKIMQSDFMLEGKIMAKEEISYDYQYTIRVKDVIKGKVSKKTITVTSAISSAACGVNLKLNEVYYLFLNQRGGGSFKTNLCSNNQIKSSSSKRYKNIIKQFKKAKKNTIWNDEQCQLVGEGKIVKEAAEGPWKFFHEDGSLESEGIYKNGNKVGMWKDYYDKDRSTDLWKRLTDEQKKAIQNKENILIRVSNYDNGKLEDSERLHQR